jgi:hydroxymethylglutaryl-CoA lyase
LSERGIKIIALSDTVGVSNPENIKHLFSNLIPELPDIEFGAHLHSHAHNWKEKIIACEESGCYRFDSAMKGIGGCPMADDDLVGNLATENIIDHFGGLNILGIDSTAFYASLKIANEIFH